ncbi:MAG: Membrane bound hydrogenase, MbhD subunit [Synergistales bacterium 54_24]|nr:MAG: Membrane bound hydrogenase, MbhD subunit [Synergistales bacterium 54_24]HAF50427.1 hydrogenase [Synergistaceae bacterium]
MADVVHTAVLVLIVVSAFFAAWFRDLLAAVISLAIMSLMISLEFYILQAPDVAIAEAGIGAGLSTAIYMIALRACKRTRR